MPPRGRQPAAGPGGRTPGPAVRRGCSRGLALTPAGRVLSGHGGQPEDGRIRRDEAELGETTGETGAELGGGDVGGRHVGRSFQGAGGEEGKRTIVLVPHRRTIVLIYSRDC